MGAIQTRHHLWRWWMEGTERDHHLSCGIVGVTWPLRYQDKSFLIRYIPDQIKQKYGSMIKYVLTELDLAGRENIWLSVIHFPPGAPIQWIITYYHMAGSVRGQDEANPAPWLVTREDKMELYCQLGIARQATRVPLFTLNPYNQSFIVQVCSGHLVLFLALLCREPMAQSIKTQ